jgi:hypothetical protein
VSVRRRSNIGQSAVEDLSLIFVEHYRTITPRVSASARPLSLL